MIYRLKFDDRTEFAQAKNHLHLLQSYESEFEGFQDIEKVEEITDEEAKTIMLQNNEYVEGEDPIEKKEFSLYDTVVGDDFCIVGSTEWV
ncbi:MAG: hypothetical protein VYB44_07290 [Bacteroidota bacterium]|nr:hypothetical protein [Bacteroidota bacterium]